MAGGEGAAALPLEVSLDRARDLFASRGPICDSEGFYQHTGQCWNDSLQMIMLFTDGLKEITQHALLTIPLTRESVEANHPARSPRALDFVYRYLLATRARFVRHYLGEILRKNTCELDEQGFASQQALYAIGKRPNLRAKGEQGKNAAAAGVQQNRHTYNYSIKGGDFFVIFSTVKIFEPMFRPGHLHVMYYHVDGPYQMFRGRNINEDSILVKESYIPGDELAIGINIPLHALAFYICGGQQYFYDDNYGPIKFPWKVFLQDYQNGIPGFVEEGGGAAGGGDPAGGAGAPQAVKTMHCAATVRVRNVRQHNVFYTQSYPILSIQAGPAAATRYFTRISEHPTPVELRFDTPLVLQVGELEYKILLKAGKLDSNKNLIESMYTYRVAGMAVPASRVENTLFGSRLYNILGEAFREVNANVVEAHATPEELAKIPNLETKLLSLPRKSNDADRIYTKVYPFLTHQQKFFAFRQSIDKDYPNLLRKVIELNPDFLTPTPRRNPIKDAALHGSIQVIPILCDGRPIEADKYDSILEYLTDNTDEDMPETLVVFQAHCRKAEAGGGRRRKTKGKRRRPRRKTKRTHS